MLKKVWSKSMKKTVLIKRSGSDSFTSLRPAPLTSIISTSSLPAGKKAKGSTPTMAGPDSDQTTFTPPPNKKQRAAPASPTGASKKKGGKGKGKAKGGETVDGEEATNSDVDVEGSSTPMKGATDEAQNSSKLVSFFCSVLKRDTWGPLLQKFVNLSQ